MSKKMKLLWKIGISVIALFLSYLRFCDPESSKEWLDSTFLILIMVPALAFLIPWDRLTAFKAAGIELVLESPSVRGALSGIKMSSSDSRKIRRALYSLKNAIQDSAGSRILWIDDHPDHILGERRILRSLGVIILSANSSDSARKLLNEDNDFDLVISDMQRESEPDSKFKRYGGIEFIKEIRQSSTDSVVKDVPVVFYTAYRPEQIDRILNQVSAKDLSDVHFCNSIEGLLRKVFEILPAIRAEAIKVRSRKPATNI